MMDRFTPSLVPPSIADERSLAFAKTARRALNEPDFRRLLVERIDEVDAALLPFLVRQFGVQRFVDPDLPEATIRRMIAGSFELHKEIGYIRGVVIGLKLLGVKVEQWEQWFQMPQQRAPGTHRVRLALDREVYPGQGYVVTTQLRRAIRRMISATQRASQDIAVAVHTGGDPAPVHIGVAFASRIRFHMASLPRTRMRGEAPAYIGVAFVSRVRHRMGA